MAIQRKLSVLKKSLMHRMLLIRKLIVGSLNRQCCTVVAPDLDCAINKFCNDVIISAQSISQLLLEAWLALTIR